MSSSDSDSDITSNDSSRGPIIPHLHLTVKLIVQSLNENYIKKRKLKSGKQKRSVIVKNLTVKVIVIMKNEKRGN